MRTRNYRLQWLLENLAALVTIMTFVVALSGLATIADKLAELLTK